MTQKYLFNYKKASPNLQFDRTGAWSCLFYLNLMFSFPKS